MTLKGCLNWKGLGNLLELIGVIYTSELKLEENRLNLNNFIVVIQRTRKLSKI